MIPVKRSLVVVLVAASVWASWSCRRQSNRAPVVILTTPDVAATGLPDYLSAAFVKQTSAPVDLRIVTTEQIIRAAEARAGYVALYRDAKLDAELIARNGLRLRSEQGSEDFYIVGPEHDPAGVRSAPTAAEAFRRIALRNATYCSPLDVSRLSDLEHELWSAAGIDPKRDRRYKICRGDGAEVLEKVSRLSGYTLVDRGTFEAARPRHLKVLLRDLPMLHYVYVVALLAPQKRADRNREWFVEWVMSYRGREVIEAFQNRGR